MPAPDGHLFRILTISAPTYNPARAAFLLLRELYVWFGHAEEDIPYAIGTDDQRNIDLAAIEHIN